MNYNIRSLYLIHQIIKNITRSLYLSRKKKTLKKSGLFLRLSLSKDFFGYRQIPRLFTETEKERRSRSTRALETILLDLSADVA